MKKGESVDNFNVDPKLKLLMGFIVNSGVQYPRKTCSKWAEEKGEFVRHKERLLNYCGKLKHWKVTNLDYRELPDIEACWFVDPPYFGAKEKYKQNNIDYEELAEWCKSRKGQVIVCENDAATWLPFRPLKEMYGQRHKTTEVIWTNES